MGLLSPVHTWFGDDRALARFRARRLGSRPALLAPRDDAWRALAPGFAGAAALAASGVPFQVVAHRRYDRSGDPRRLRGALDEGKTVFLPQVHQVLPRVARLMVALRAALLGPFREECSFLFLVRGIGRAGMGLHHDGGVDAFWVQLAGRRTVTVGPPVPEGTPEDLGDDLPSRGHRGNWWTRALEPGTLLYLPPRTPHRVVCHEPSLALSLTWKLPDARDALVPLLERLDPATLPETPARSLAILRRVATSALARAGAAARGRGLAAAYAAGLATWDVAAGRPATRPPARRGRLWTQVPAVPLPADGPGNSLRLWTPGGTVRLPPSARRLARGLVTMPSFPRRAAEGSDGAIAVLLRSGIVAPRDLPLRIVPVEPAALDGWNFA